MSVNTHINLMVLGGHLMAKPEIKKVHITQKNPDGIEMCKFEVMHNSSSKIKNQTEEQTTILNVESFKTTVIASAKEADKGDAVVVYGTWQKRLYEKDGIKMYYDRCFANAVEFSKSKANAEKQEEPGKLFDK